MTTETKQAPSNSEEVLTPQINSTSSANGKSKPAQAPQKKGVSLSPEQLQFLVMQQLNQVNAKKDELTIAIKNLSDLATQLGQICAQQNKALQGYKKIDSNKQ